ncbi:MAG TPA: M20/M25/M40 family metallo-hydrolase [Chloroflexia bacterium]|jgi:acetylornithine deacetylase/succinyl-diaminopimelate desuccinylase-like protein
MGDMIAADFEAYDQYIEQHFDEMVQELRDFCAQPTLAGQRIGVEEGVVLVRGLLEGVGARTLPVPAGDAPPVVLAELGSGERTLLMYNHYDVQPPEPLELWDSPPYAGDVRDGNFYARGVADDRGDFLSRVLAIRAYKATIGDLPLRLRWLVEGEEEVGSPNLAPVVGEHADDLRADWCAWEGSSRNAEGTPQVVCGVKGMLYVELHATGPDHDAHSGLGGILPNPAWRLVMALSTLRDERGNFVMDGLDEIVDMPTQLDMRAMEAMPFEEQSRLAIYGLDHWQRGLQGREVLAAEMFEPTANIAGFTSGYSGGGAKTIVPSKAVVKMDFRLVPSQTPDKMLALLRAHFDKRGYGDVEIVQIGALQPAKTPVDSALVQAAAEVWRDLGEEGVVVVPTTGGSGPMSLITAELGIPTVIAGGLANAESRVHSPNESIRLDDFKSAIRYWGRFFVRLAAS